MTLPLDNGLHRELDIPAGGCSYQLDTPNRILARVSPPTFLIIEKEQPEGLSSRKLIVETAKYNVLTAYSAKEGLEIFKEHPVNAVVLHSSVQDIPCDSMVKQIKKQQPDMPVIILSATGLDQCSRQTRSSEATTRKSC